MFFKSKKKIENEEIKAKLADEDELKQDLDKAVVPSMDASDEDKTSASQEDVQLFPGLEDQPFEVGYAPFSSEEYGLDSATPMLLMRWKEGKQEWFPVPSFFNKVLLDRIHQRDTDLDQMLSDYGYETGASDRPSQGV